MEKYIERLIDPEFKKIMGAMGCVCIEGPKWCGKSTTGGQLAKTTVRLQEPAAFKRYTMLAGTGDKHLLDGEKPLMFDEWQKIPELWDYIRMSIDENYVPGQYILTGSAKPREDKNRHTGTGRIAKITLYPMSLWESGDSSGEISLKNIFDGRHEVYGNSKLTLDGLAFAICRGGWPQSVTHPEIALSLIDQYYVALTTADIVDVDGINRNPRRAQAILRSYARHISTFASNTTIMADVAANDMTVDKTTFASYITAFEKLFVISDIEAWSPRLRSKTAIRAAAKRQFVDPSLAARALSAGPKDLVADLNTLGLLFESLCERDLRIYAQTLGGYTSHYHDQSGLEADTVLHLGDGRWGAVEIKLGGNMIDNAAANLIKLKDKVDAAPPSFLMVLTGTPYAYKRPDGVLVVPIGCLKN